MKEYTSVISYRANSKLVVEDMKQICVTMDESMVETLQDAAAAMQITFSAAVRIAVLKGLNQLDETKVI